MAKKAFKSIRIMQGKAIKSINETPTEFVFIKTIDNKSISVEYDSNLKAYCITTSGDIKILGEEQNAVYFKIKKSAV